MPHLWIWIRVPLDAVYRAIHALKDSVPRTHLEASKTDDPERRARLRAQADQDEASAEELKRALRDDEPPPPNMG